MLSGVFFELRPFATFFWFLKWLYASPLVMDLRFFVFARWCFCAEAFLGGGWLGAIHALVVSVR
jgi:hypothetical protein